MEIYEWNIGDQFYWQDCIWSVTGNIEAIAHGSRMDLFRECYNHDTRQTYSLPGYAFRNLKPTPWSVE